MGERMMSSSIVLAGLGSKPRVSYDLTSTLTLSYILFLLFSSKTGTKLSRLDLNFCSPTFLELSILLAGWSPHLAFSSFK